MQGTVTVSAPTGRAVAVALASSDITEITVPASIVMARGTKLDGRNPLILYGYGVFLEVRGRAQWATAAEMLDFVERDFARILELVPR